MADHPSDSADVVIVGAGPAGRVLAVQCAERGLATALIDGDPDAGWPATYGMWSTDVPPDLPRSAVAATAKGVVVARTRRELDRDYTVLDTAGLRTHLDRRLAAAGVSVRTARVTGGARGAVLLAGGRRVRARWVVDAGGKGQALAGRRSARPRAEQTAYGVVVPETLAAPLVAPGSALFMDWRPDHGDDGWPTFLYGIPLGGGSVLLEETSLARRPGLPYAALRTRLTARLAAHGVALPPDGAVEHVRFPLDLPRHRGAGVLGFGAAAPFVHPASGFSLADTLRIAPRLADALRAGDERAARRALWPWRAAAVHRVRRIGLEALLRMPPERVPDFFEAFFALPDYHRHAYLAGRDEIGATAAAMLALFARVDTGTRARLVGPALRPPAPPLPSDSG